MGANHCETCDGVFGSDAKRAAHDCPPTVVHLIAHEDREEHEVYCEPFPRTPNTRLPLEATCIRCLEEARQRAEAMVVGTSARLATLRGT